MSEQNLGSAIPNQAPSKVALGGWVIDSRQGRLVILPMLVLFMAYAAEHYVSRVPAGDFTALWSYGRSMLVQPSAVLYDVGALHAFQVGLGMDPARDFPFPYPPVFLLMVWPLGLLPLGQAYYAWVGLTFAAFVWAVAGPRPNALVVLAILAAPASTMNVIAGQSGFLSGALLIGGLRVIGTRPWLGGLLLGLLTYKPQFGLLVPVALLAAGAVWLLVWRTPWGYALRVMGESPEVARYAGIDQARTTILVMALAGALARGGAVDELLGAQHRLLLGFTGGYGFTGIAVALMGRNHPVGILFAALLFGALTQGGAELAFDAPDIPAEIVVLIQGLVILFAGALGNMLRPALVRVLGRA